MKKATSGRVIFTLPTPEEIDKRGKDLEEFRCTIADIRNKIDDLRYTLIKEGSLEDDGITRDFRDANAFLTAALVILHPASSGFPKWAQTKREMLAHPEIYVIQEGNPSTFMKGSRII